MTFEEYLKVDINFRIKEIERLKRTIIKAEKERSNHFGAALNYAHSFDRNRFERAFKLVGDIKSLKMEDYHAPPLIQEKELEYLVNEFESIDAVLVYYRNHCRSLKAEAERLNTLKTELKENEDKLKLLIETQAKLQGLNLLPEVQKVPND